MDGGLRPPPDIRRFKIKEDKDMIDREKKAAIIAEYGRSEGDRSPEVQVAILTARINELTEHFKAN